MSEDIKPWRHSPLAMRWSPIYGLPLFHLSCHCLIQEIRTVANPEEVLKKWCDTQHHTTGRHLPLPSFPSLNHTPVRPEQRELPREVLAKHSTECKNDVWGPSSFYCQHHHGCPIPQMVYATWQALKKSAWWRSKSKGERVSHRRNDFQASTQSIKPLNKHG